MNRKTIGMMILGILLVGGVSAGLIGWLSNTIAADVSVSGPVFYLDGEHEDGAVYHKLYINELPPEEEIYFWNGHRLIFKTENLGVDNFYPINFEARVWMKTNNSGNTFQARFIKLNENNIEKTICEVENPITIGATAKFTKYVFGCSINSEIDLSSYNRIGLELRGNGDENQEYWIITGKKYTDGASRIEVSAA